MPTTPEAAPLKRPHTFSKAERLCSQKRITALFAPGNRSLAAFPLRAVYVRRERTGGEDVAVEVLISVSKRRFKHAVDRNRVKRLVREAYRKNKYILWDALGDEEAVDVAFIYLSTELPTADTVERKVKNLLARVAEQLHEAAL